MVAWGVMPARLRSPAPLPRSARGAGLRLLRSARQGHGRRRLAARRSSSGPRSCTSWSTPSRTASCRSTPSSRPIPVTAIGCSPARPSSKARRWPRRFDLHAQGPGHRHQPPARSLDDPGPDHHERGRSRHRQGAQVPARSPALPLRRRARLRLPVQETPSVVGHERVYRDPPRSTTQILHPEKYLDAREDPVAVVIPGPLTPPARAAGSCRTTTSASSPSAPCWRSHLGETEGRRAAAGWRGDRYRIWEDDGRALRHRVPRDRGRTPQIAAALADQSPGLGGEASPRARRQGSRSRDGRARDVGGRRTRLRRRASAGRASCCWSSSRAQALDRARDAVWRAAARGRAAVE